MELVLELSDFADIFQSTFIEFYLLVGHNAASCIALGRVIQTFGHTRQNFLYFLVLVMELITCSDVRLEKQCDGLEQVVNIAKANVDV